MPHGQPGAILRQLHRIVGAQTSQDIGDAELVHRYALGRDETAFTALCLRHAPLVWGVCRRLLGHDQDAEDAFQATFLVLARNAASIRKAGSVGSWLYGVAYRVAIRAKKSAVRRRKQEAQAGSQVQAPAVSEAALRELQALLDDEVSRLPEKL